MKSTDRILAIRYAHAYDALSADATQAEAAYQALQRAVAALGQARAYMQAPAISTVEKQAFVQTLFGKQNQVTAFLSVLLKAKRYYLLENCLQEVGHLLDKRNGIVRARVESAFELTPAQKQQVEQTLSRFTGKKAHAQFAVRAALLGGLRVQIEDTLIEGSLKGRFEKLAAELIQ